MSSPWAKLVFTGGDGELMADNAEVLLTTQEHSFGRLDATKKDQRRSDFSKHIVNRPFVSGTHFTVSRKEDENGLGGVMNLLGIERARTYIETMIFSFVFLSLLFFFVFFFLPSFSEHFILSPPHISVCCFQSMNQW